jgi:hypothetical protein
VTDFVSIYIPWTIVSRYLFPKQSTEYRRTTEVTSGGRMQGVIFDVSIARVDMTI